MGACLGLQSLEVISKSYICYSASIQNSITVLQKPDRALPHPRCFQASYPGGDEMREGQERSVGAVGGKKWQ